MHCFVFRFFFKKAQNQAKSQEDKPASDSVMETLGEKDADERLLQEFEDEMSDLSVPTDKIEVIKEEMQKEFDNIINEVCGYENINTEINVSIKIQCFDVTPYFVVGPAGIRDRRLKRGV